MFYRGRRLRKNPVIRQLTRETQLSPLDFVYPIFVAEGENLCQPIPSMPGVFRWSVDRLGEVLARMEKAGVKACLLFGIPDHKDEIGSAAWDENGVVQRAMAQIRRLSPEMYIIGDVCMCEYTSHGHCGILDETGYVKNDEILALSGAPPESQPERQLSERAGAEELRELILALREPYRQVCILFFLEELPQPEIAARLGRPLRTVSSQIARARQMLQKQIKERSAGNNGTGTV